MKDITEKEFCLSRFEEKFGWLKRERIALYGTGINAKAILQQFPEYDIVCLVDDKSHDRYVENHYVVSMDEFVELGINKLIIAAKIESALEVYARIGRICFEAHISVFDMYGNDMQKVRRNLTFEKIQYPQTTIKDLYESIDIHDVISFDLDNTLMSPFNIDFSDFYLDIEEKLCQEGIEIKNFCKSILSLRRQKIWISMEELCIQACNAERLSQEEMQTVIAAAKEAVMNKFVKRNPIWKAMKYAIDKDKKICVIEDMQGYRIPEKWIREIFENNGVRSVNLILCSSAFMMNKFTGLFRILKEQFGEMRYLHIGDHEATDCLVPQFYGIDTFKIFSAFDCNQMFGKLTVNRQMLDVRSFRQVFDRFLLAVYNDVCFVNDYKEPEGDAKDLELKVKILKDRLKQKVEKIAFSPVLYDDITIKSDLGQYPKLKFKINDNPLVSIIIPVYNQFGYTYNCLKSILEYSEDIKYEVIIADDCSTDQVKELEKVALGVTVIHNVKNLKFLLNCNNAAKYAKGKYILFLNNDTQVQPGWLKPLLETMEEHAEAGMVGSKLVYPDGHLQEAGGILWSDGSAWNFGNMKDPEAPEYCYMKEADYISGAAVMIRASLWKEIGGFDESFAPAYYEDTDLAFEVRKKGYKVFLQPASIVVHFEGVSNGTNTASGLKAYQVINQKKFFEKWGDVLKKDHFPNGEEIYLAKDRGQFKKQILVVDHYVPNYDKDAGGRCTYMYLRLFLRMGLKVTFIGDNFARPEPYTTELNKLGVEILFGNYYFNNWEGWLCENLHYFDYIYIQRPHISIKYIDIVKKYARGKVFYFAHDLHHIRMYRDYLLTGDKKALEESERWKGIEMELFAKADVGHVVGNYEQAVMQEAFPDKPIRNIPLYFYEELPKHLEKDFSKRKDILFVGGFNHVPNIDAVKWFAEKIYPQILQVHPDMVWHIVGSKAPEEILKLASPNIVLEGFVSDDELEILYRNCRLAVVPLRYGAGVKGKVVESAYYQIPLVTTSIGGEGLDPDTKAFLMEDDANKMAKIISDLYSDYPRLREMSDAGAEYISKYFTLDAAENVLLEDMDIDLGQGENA